MSPTRQFGGFDLYEKIGTGGMATVYRGVQRSLDRPVVLKILHPHLSEDQSLIVRFEREARAAANLRHENIVQVIDCGREESTSYIAMEFVDGMDLKRLMDTYGPPPIEMAALILRDICRGLEHAHHHRVIHRDIKPANLMLTPDGTIKIMDFGLARRGEDSVGMTATGAVLGTPAYMSPEQAMGERVDERSDIFSLGVVGYEMFGGRRPFPGDSYASVLNAILSVTPDPLDAVNPQVPPEIVRVIARMLEKDVAHRYQSVSEVRDELETIVERMGLVRGRDLLRRYAASPAAVTQTLNGVRGPGGSLTVSSAVAELLIRAADTTRGGVEVTRGGGADMMRDPDPQSTRPGGDPQSTRGGDPQSTRGGDSQSTRGGDSQSTRGGAGVVRGGQDTVVFNPPDGAAGSGNGDVGATAVRDSSIPGASRTGAGRSAPAEAPPSVDETVAETISGRASTPRWSAGASDRSRGFPPEAGRKPGLSRNAMIGIGAGAVVLIGIVVGIFKFAGPGGDDTGSRSMVVKSDGAGGKNVQIDVGADGAVKVGAGTDTSHAPGAGNLSAGRDAGDPGADNGLAEPRSDNLGVGRRGADVIPPKIPPPTVPDAEAIRRRVQRQTDEILASTQKLKEQTGKVQIDTGVTGVTRKYLVNSKPSFTFIYVDGASKPVNPEGKPAAVTLKAGRHTFHAVNKDVVPPIDVTFHYDVGATDTSNSLILNLNTRTVEARTNAQLPF